jgi:hypothetical protein
MEVAKFGTGLAQNACRALPIGFLTQMGSVFLLTIYVKAPILMAFAHLAIEVIILKTELVFFLLLTLPL